MINEEHTNIEAVVNESDMLNNSELSWTTNLRFGNYFLFLAFRRTVSKFVHEILDFFYSQRLEISIKEKYI